MPWGSFLHSGTVGPIKAKGRVIADGSVGKWRDAQDRPLPPSLINAGNSFVASRIHNLIVVGSRPTTPPPCHVEVPSAAH